jgi:hypothetical protein
MGFDRRDAKALRELATQRDRGAADPELERVAVGRPGQQFRSIRSARLRRV